MSNENANYVRTEIKIYYQHDIDKLQAENKRLREALLEIARIEPSPIFSYSSKDIDKICIIAEQALGETHATKTNMARQ